MSVPRTSSMPVGGRLPLGTLGMSTGARGALPVTRTPCRGTHPLMAAVIASPQGHSLAATQTISADGGEGILLCLQCGAWATKRPVKLRRRELPVQDTLDEDNAVAASSWNRLCAWNYCRDEF